MKPQLETLRSSFENLFENKAIYRERFIYVVRLERVLITEAYFGASAVPLLGITPYYLSEITVERGYEPLTEPWSFGTDWELTSRCDDTEICSPYAGWTIWIKPDVVRAFELLAVSRKRISTIGSKAGR